MRIQLKVLNKRFYNEMLLNPLPFYATPGSAAVDLISTSDVSLLPGECQKIGTGIAVYIKDENVMGVIAPRSGLGTSGLVLANTIGIIDSDYTGELIVSAWNRNSQLSSCYPVAGQNGDGSVVIRAGERFAQLMFVPVIKAQWDVVEEFSEDTQRGHGGFGSSGK